MSQSQKAPDGVLGVERLGADCRAIRGWEGLAPAAVSCRICRNSTSKRDPMSSAGGATAERLGTGHRVAGARLFAGREARWARFL